MKIPENDEPWYLGAILLVLVSVGFFATYYNDISGASLGTINKELCACQCRVTSYHVLNFDVYRPSNGATNSQECIEKYDGRDCYSDEYGENLHKGVKGEILENSCNYINI